MTKATLYGSLTSPYVRLVRLVLKGSGAEDAVRFEVASPFDADHRDRNPLGKVPALHVKDGPLVAETTLIVRTVNAWGHTDLLPKDPAQRLQAEADITLMMGMLDLGVAFFLESKRDEPEQSKHWQDRRRDGLHAALPFAEEAAIRGADDPTGAAALAVAITFDWLSFRLGDVVDWQTVCPRAAAFVAEMLAREELAATDPRLA